MALLHRLSLKDEGRELSKNGRHLYDTYKLLGAEVIMMKLQSEPETLARLAADADALSEKWGLAFEPRHSRGYSTGPAFETTSSAAGFLRKGFGSAQPLIYGAVPAFEECIEAVHKVSDFL